MARILITGRAGVLGSNLSELFLQMGDDVTIIDVIRKDECWRLQSKGIVDQVDYDWKASQDLSKEDLKNIDLDLQA